MEIRFSYLDWRERKQQSFDKNNIKTRKAGVEYNNYDKIQEAREDTEIYETLEKYGCLDKIMLNKEGVYGDFTKFKGLRELKEQQEMAENMFNRLPLEVRKEFQNDKSLFMRDGEKWIKNKIDTENAKKTQIEEIKAADRAQMTEREAKANG